MDPLSITTSIITFIEIAKRIKASVDKIGQNRRTLRELTQNVVNELLELQKLCERREGTLNGSDIDQDLTISLDDLRSELSTVLERCQKILKPSNRTRLASMKSGIKAWLKSSEIETDIIRLKDHVSSFHRRFTYITSLRMENRLLVVNTENRARMNRMEGLVARLLIDSHVTGIKPPVFLDHACRDGIEFQYLRLQVQRILDNLRRISITQTFAQEEPSGVHCEPLELFTYLSHIGTEASLLRTTMIATLQILQALESNSGNLSIQYGAYDLMNLGNLLWDLDMYQDAAAVDTWAIDIYRTLMLGDTNAFMPFVAWGLLNLGSFRSGTREGLESCKAAVAMYRALVDAAQDHDYTSSLPRAMRNYSTELFLDGQYEASLEQAKEALALQRRVSDQTSQRSDAYIFWEASGEEVVVFSSARSFWRTTSMAFEEGMCLQQLAATLAMLGRYQEALIAGNDAINCYQALANYFPGSYDSRLNEVRASRSGWVMLVHEPTLTRESSAEEIEEEVCQAVVKKVNKVIAREVTERSAEVTLEIAERIAEEAPQEAVTLGLADQSNGKTQEEATMEADEKVEVMLS